MRSDKRKYLRIKNLIIFLCTNGGVKNDKTFLEPHKMCGSKKRLKDHKKKLDTRNEI